MINKYLIIVVGGIILGF